MHSVHDSGNIGRMYNTLTIHGANPENLYRAFNLPMPDKILDFSTNTNILAWPEVNINLQELASRYPDPDCSKLRMLVSEREHIPPSRILFTNGSNEAIFLLSGLFSEDTAILQPAYSEYSRAFRNLHSISSIEEAHKFRHVIIINPNNPTGKYTPLREVICSCPDTVFIVDEAYRDFLLTGDPESLCDCENVILVRSLTKIFHLSGARIGYVIAPERIIAAMRERLPSWNVNGIAQELALVFLNDRAFLERTRVFYREQTPNFMEAVRRAGVEVVQSDVHYFLVRVYDDLRVIGHLLKAGIVVRHTRNFEGLDGKYIRIAARHPEENNLLISAMKELLR
ncbi:MAG: pyridoxal phosphate-dependent class II aminotransferase [Synergistaceae bacterium]|nr:pyridoxal phosphate-dependent class II aminotransferase [Synergistaceae bacterium]